jgi:hypothetical protein
MVFVAWARTTAATNVPRPVTGRANVILDGEPSGLMQQHAL